MLTATDVAMLGRLRDRLPELQPEDRDHVMAYGVVLYTAGIPGDAAKERSHLEDLIVQYAWRIKFCRYVERCVAQFGEAVTFGEWKETYAT